MKHTDQYHGLVPGFQGNSARLLSHSHADEDEEFCLVLAPRLLRFLSEYQKRRLIMASKFSRCSLFLEFNIYVLVIVQLNFT